MIPVGQPRVGIGSQLALLMLLFPLDTHLDNVKNQQQKERGGAVFACLDLLLLVLVLLQFFPLWLCLCVCVCVFVDLVLL